MTPPKSLAYQTFRMTEGGAVDVKAIAGLEKHSPGVRVMRPNNLQFRDNSLLHWYTDPYLMPI